MRCTPYIRTRFTLIKLTNNAFAFNEKLSSNLFLLALSEILKVLDLQIVINQGSL